MSDSIEIDYEHLVQDALRCVVRDVLSQTAQHGLIGEHHFYIAFLTDYPGVHIPDYLREEYSNEITIVIQHEFWDLTVEDDRFSITLCFDDVDENLVIPFGALTSFVDPSVRFGLQFTPTEFEDPLMTKQKEPSKNQPLEPVATEIPAEPTDEQKDGSNIVTLDTFRKK